MWLDVDGDNTYAIDWPLTKDSIVIEVGAYKGRWSKQIADKYECTVYAFEPQTWAYEEIVKLNNPHIKPYNYGLGTKTQAVMLGEFGTDACSIYTVGSSRKDGPGDLLEAEEALVGLGLLIDEINLMMMNIEGYEYELLNYMLNTGILTFIKTFCVQWHTFKDESGYKYNNLSARFRALGYKLQWSFFPTLECWSRVNG